MDLKTKLKLAEIAAKLFQGDAADIKTYDYDVVKPNFFNTTPKPSGLRYTTPEKVGMSSRHIANFLRALEAPRGISPHSIAIMRKGKIIAEGSWAPYTAACPHTMYSISKTVTAMAIGILIDEGRLALDTVLCEIFADEKLFDQKRNKAITVEHLLIMSAGPDFDEASSLVTSGWLKSFSDAALKFKPGEKFYYNSLNTYVLSAIVHKITGEQVSAFLQPRIFGPLGIAPVYWDQSPEGIDVGGWGLYLRLHDMLKLGTLFLNGGNYTVGGKTTQLLPKWWVEQATKQHIEATVGVKKTGYGYQLWMYPFEGAYLFNGIFGQYIVVIPKHELVIAQTGGSDNLFPVGQMVDIISKYFNDDEIYSPYQRYEDKRDAYFLKDTILGLRAAAVSAPYVERTLVEMLFGRKKQAPQQVPAIFWQFDGKVVALENNSIGIMPTILQALHRNFSHGTNAFSLKINGGECLLTVFEYDRENSIKIGIDGKARYSEFTAKEEAFAIGAMGSFAFDEQSKTMRFVADISFIETPHIRKIVFEFGENGITVSFNEQPSLSGAVRLLGKLVNESAFFQEKVLNRLMGNSVIQRSSKNFLEPTVKGTLVD